MRQVIAVATGYISWSVLWVSFNMGLQQIGLLPADATQPVTATSPLLLLLAGSALLSLLAGYVAAVISRGNVRTVLVVAALLLATGAFFEYQNWALLPVWYHIVFLVLLVPVCLLGFRLRVRSER